MSFIPGVQHDKSLDDGQIFVLVHQGRILFPAAENFAFASRDLLCRDDIVIERFQYIGVWQGKACMACSVTVNEQCIAYRDDEAADAFWRSYALRSMVSLVSADMFQLLGYAVQVQRWHEEHQFCGRCGNATVLVPGERARECNVCAIRNYPRISPCVIGLIHRGDKCLLAHHARHKRHKTGEKMFALIAGFIEPGESAEEALIREVREEVGLNIDWPIYIESQSWPFPGQLMLGFHAVSATGDIEVDGDEITEAGWFDENNLPLIPPLLTISRALIDRFFERGCSE